jgi:hypothetical protein
MDHNVPCANPSPSRRPFPSYPLPYCRGSKHGCFSFFTTAPNCRSLRSRSPDRSRDSARSSGSTNGRAEIRSARDLLHSSGRVNGMVRRFYRLHLRYKRCTRRCSMQIHTVARTALDADRCDATGGTVRTRGHGPADQDDRRQLPFTHSAPYPDRTGPRWEQSPAYFVRSS